METGVFCNRSKIVIIRVYKASCIFFGTLEAGEYIIKKLFLKFYLVKLSRKILSRKIIS